MKTKIIEVRDEMTFIALICIDMNPGDIDPYEINGVFVPRSSVGYEKEYDIRRWFLRRCGYPCDGRPNILIARLDGYGKASNDPYAWGGRTFPVAHQYIIEHWNDLRDGDVVDVQFLLGETSFRKISERLK